MKAISLWQPWASLMADGVKRVETRSWKTDYRGPLVIHAAKRNDGWPDDFNFIKIRKIFLFDKQGYIKFGHLPFGKIIGLVLLKSCIQITKETRPPHWPDDVLGDYTPRRWAWVTGGFIKFKKAIPFRGRQRIFNVPDCLVGEALGWPGGCKFEGAYGSDECSPLEYHD